MNEEHKVTCICGFVFLASSVLRMDLISVITLFLRRERYNNTFA